MAIHHSIESFDLTTRSGRYCARKAGFDIPKRHAGSAPVDFWSRIRKSDGCWEFSGKIGTHGYGEFAANGRSYRAHRWSWELCNGSIPSGVSVCHHCDNPRCVNPAHLFLGTQAENISDKVKKNRQARGERQGAAKLTFRKAEEIRRLVATGQTKAAIGRQFGVSRRTVLNIANGAIWKCA